MERMNAEQEKFLDIILDGIRSKLSRKEALEVLEAATNIATDWTEEDFNGTYRLQLVQAESGEGDAEE